MRASLKILIQLSSAALLLLSTSAFAVTQNLWDLHLTKPIEVTNSSRGFLFPNELNLDSKPQIWQGVDSSGAYVSVGSERSFVGAALAHSVALVGVDMDPNITGFNRINAALLALSTSPEDYLSLRLSADYSKINERQKNSPLGFQISKADWAWWQNVHADKQWYHLFHSESPADLIKRFRQVAYWNNLDRWSHLHELAKNKKMGFFTLNLTDQQGLRALTAEIFSLGLGVSAVDTSNVLEYIGAEEMTKTLLAFTSNYKNSTHWIYSQQRSEDRFYGQITGEVDAKLMQEEPWIFGAMNLTFTPGAIAESIRFAILSFPKPRGPNIRCHRLFDPDIF